MDWKYKTEPNIVESRPCVAGDYIDRMRKSLAAKKRRGLNGIRFCAVPPTGADKLTANDLAKAYCEAFGC